MKTKINLVLALVVLMAASLGMSQSNISFSTANISDLKFGTNNAANPQSEIFGPKDKVYIVSEVQNTQSKHKVKIVFLNDDVKGKEAGSLAADCAEIDVPGEHSFNCSVFSEKGRLPTGRYKAQAVLLSEDGSREIDRREGTFEIVNDYEW
jgi:hypothetical protein